MIDCPECKHSTYWHEQRREDDPDQFLLGHCLCGCDHYKVTTYSGDGSCYSKVITYSGERK